MQAIMRIKKKAKDRKPWDEPWNMISFNLAERISIKNGELEVQSKKPSLAFHIDAEASLIDGHILRAVLKDDEGDKRTSSLNLDNYLGNNNCMSHFKHFPL
jgi:hypothetical protein